jgi:hypothetical protein
MKKALEKELKYVKIKKKTEIPKILHMTIFLK